MQVRDTGGWWRIVIDYGAKSAKFCAGEGERGAIPTSASNPNCECSKDLGGLKAPLSAENVSRIRARRCGVHSAAAGYTSESACTNLHTKGQVHEGKIQDVSAGKGVLVPGQWDRETGDAWNKRSGGRASSAPCEE